MQRERRVPGSRGCRSHSDGFFVGGMLAIFTNLAAVWQTTKHHWAKSATSLMFNHRTFGPTVLCRISELKLLVELVPSFVFVVRLTPI